MISRGRPATAVSHDPGDEATGVQATARLRGPEVAPAKTIVHTFVRRHPL